MAVPQRKYWRPKNLVMASLNFINTRAIASRDAMQQSEFFPSICNTN